MNSQELETAARLETLFVAFVFNDWSYGLIRWKQRQQFDRPVVPDNRRRPLNPLPFDLSILRRSAPQCAVG